MEEIEVTSKGIPFPIFIPKGCDLDICNRVEIRGREFLPVVRCKDCKYRPHLRDAVDEDDAEALKHGYFNGFDLRFPTEGKCPCQVLDDEFYSWIPKDDWFCANGKRKEDD